MPFVVICLCFAVVPSVCLWSSSSFVMGGRPCWWAFCIHCSGPGLSSLQHSTGKGRRCCPVLPGRTSALDPHLPPSEQTRKAWWDRDVMGVSALGTLSHIWGRTRTRRVRVAALLKSVYGVVALLDRKRFDQRMSSSSSELSIFLPAGVPI